MTIAALNEAVAEAKRFLDRVRKLTAIFPKLSTQTMTVERCPEAAAVRRASLDLTKALARLRKP